MHLCKLFAAPMVPVALLLAGCATTSDFGQRARLEPPQQPMESIRLIIYRPQTLVGMLGKPVVFVNGQQMGIKGSPVNENLLEPGSVFVVDAPATLTHVSWLQSSKAQSRGEAITYQGLQGVKRYLRWTLKPTYGYLQEVDEVIAAEEIPPLRYTGYLDLTRLQ
jgi:hypothetical protein